MQSRGWAAEVPASLRNCGIIEVGQTSRKFAGNGWWSMYETNQRCASVFGPQDLTRECATETFADKSCYVLWFAGISVQFWIWEPVTL